MRGQCLEIEDAEGWERIKEKTLALESMKGFNNRKESGEGEERGRQAFYF